MTPSRSPFAGASGRGGSRLRRRQRGVALALVVSFIAGLSLLVAGLVLTAKTDTRLARVHLARAQVTALGDGAINLLLGDVIDGRLSPPQTQAQSQTQAQAQAALPQARYVLGGVAVSVLALPESLLLDLSSASAAQFAALAEFTGLLSLESGQLVARAVVHYRDGEPNDGEPNRAQRLNSLEDILNVDGVNRVTLEALRDYVTVSRGAQAARADVPDARVFTQLRQCSPEARAVREDMLAPTFEPPAVSGAFRVDALIRQDRDVWLRRRWVRLGGGRDGLPWTVTRTEPVRMVPRPS